jgi:hypothetical protein
MAGTSQHGRRSLSIILFIVHLSFHPPDKPRTSLIRNQAARLRHFLFLSGRGKSDDPYNPSLPVQLETDMFSYCDSLHDLRANDQHRQLVSAPAVWTVMLRTVESIDSTVLPVTVVAVGSSLKLIGPTAPMKINTLIMVIANVFMSIFLSITPIAIVSLS